MAIIGALLSVALGSTRYPIFDSSGDGPPLEGAIPARCLSRGIGPEDDSTGYDSLYTAILLEYLTVSYINRAILFPMSTSKARTPC